MKTFALVFLCVTLCLATPLAAALPPPPAPPSCGATCGPGEDAAFASALINWARAVAGYPCDPFC